MNAVLHFYLFCLVIVCATTTPSLDDLWSGNAFFSSYANLTVDSPGFEDVDAGTRVVVINATWYLFGREDSGATAECPDGIILINVRASLDQGLTWGAYSIVAAPDQISTCIYADGSAFYDTDTDTWHYLSQVLAVGNVGGWQLSHFTCLGPSPFGTWQPDEHNPVVHSGQLFNQICAGTGKHCELGMIDEGTPQIVEKLDGDFYVTFHGYDYNRKQAARGVARTPDFFTWYVTGGAGNLPGDVIFSALDCNTWNVPWSGGCIGSGEASIVRAPSNYMYQVIEAADQQLGCETGIDTQWWPLGLVRSQIWSPSPQWEQMQSTPFVGGPVGNEPQTGCRYVAHSFLLPNTHQAYPVSYLFLF